MKVLVYIVILFVLCMPVAAGPIYHPLPPKDENAIFKKADIIIEGSPEFTEHIEVSLELLRAKEPIAYMLVRDYIRAIEETDTQVGFFVLTGRFYWRIEGNAQYCASVLAHEAAHGWLFFRGHEYKGKNAEAFCNTVQAITYERVGGGDEKFIEWLLRDSLETRWWERGFGVLQRY